MVGVAVGATGGTQRGSGGCQGGRGRGQKVVLGGVGAAGGTEGGAGGCQGAPGLGPKRRFR